VKAFQSFLVGSARTPTSVAAIRLLDKTGKRRIV
jgi:hypothetical protein